MGDRSKERMACAYGGFADRFMGEIADRVVITDVTLREYGQNVPSPFLHVFSPQIRIEIAQKLIGLGFRGIELLSCVHPRIAPAMSEEAIKTISRGLGRVRSCHIITLVPNRAGYRNFLSYGLVPTGTTTLRASFFLQWKPTTFSTWEVPSRRRWTSARASPRMPLRGA